MRILDASSNRAREGLRVIEDFVRLTLDDPYLTQQLKELRHRLTAAFSCIPDQPLLASRETQRDVGTRSSTASEWNRSDLTEVVRANFKRLQESLRSLEEYGKVRDIRFAQQLEQLRYESYTLERAIWTTVQSQTRLSGVQLYVLVTSDQTSQGFESTVKAALKGGAQIIQLREKNLPDRIILEQARKIRKWTHDANAIFIMNDRPDIALLAQADGVHIGQDELTVKDTRVVVGPSKLIGVSTHSLVQAQQAVRDGADYIGIGPVFPSKTKAFDNYVGLSLVREITRSIRLPSFAIGGIDHGNIEQVLKSGASRVAVSAAVCKTETPQDATCSLRETLHVFSNRHGDHRQTASTSQ